MKAYYISKSCSAVPQFMEVELVEERETGFAFVYRREWWGYYPQISFLNEIMTLRKIQAHYLYIIKENPKNVKFVGMCSALKTAIPWKYNDMLGGICTPIYESILKEMRLEAPAFGAHISDKWSEFWWAPADITSRLLTIQSLITKFS